MFKDCFKNLCYVLMLVMKCYLEIKEIRILCE